MAKLNSLADSVTLPGTTVQMPLIGFGVYQVPADTCAQATKLALDAGYRHIDTAQLYRNEAEVGKAILASGVSRSGIFVTTKIGMRGATAEATYDLALASVKRIAGDGPDAYVDLFLIHIPWVKGEAVGRKELWQALERLLEEGKTRAIGVSNYGVEHLEELREYAKVWPPHVNQIQVSYAAPHAVQL